MDTGPNDDYSRPPRNKAELLERIEREWAALERTLEHLTDEQMNAPDSSGWSTKDNLAHLAAWEQFMRLYHLRNQSPYEAMQVDEATFEQLSEDEQNDVLYQRNRDRPVSDVKDELRRSHQQVLTDLERLSYEDLMKPRFPGDPQARPLIGWVIGNTYEHYREHRAYIEKIVEQAKQ
jgi:uncharacterized protein (TIGR03083 family)